MVKVLPLPWLPLRSFIPQSLLMVPFNTETSRQVKFKLLPTPREKVVNSAYPSYKTWQETCSKTHWTYKEFKNFSLLTRHKISKWKTYKKMNLKICQKWSSNSELDTCMARLRFLVESSWLSGEHCCLIWLSESFFVWDALLDFSLWFINLTSWMDYKLMKPNRQS